MSLAVPHPLDVRTALRSPRLLRIEVLGGLVVALALIPEAISFSVIAGVDPRVGLWASVTMAITISIVGGRPAMISAATGAVALVVAPVAREHGLHVHLDGARLWNASVASGTSLADFASCATTVMVSFSKGLGAPVGAALAGSRALLEEGWTVRKRLGGGMRQSGILAAAVLHALDTQLPRLADDHAHAAEFARLVDGAGGACVVPPETNIVMIDLPGDKDAAAVVSAAAAAGVLVSLWSRTRIRAVFHRDVDAAMTRTAGETMARVLEHA